MTNREAGINVVREMMGDQGGRKTLMRQPHEFAIHMGAGLNNGLTLKEILPTLSSKFPNTDGLSRICNYTR
jgi:hypothetical protein